jgi:hypothetical protein
VTDVETRRYSLFLGLDLQGFSIYSSTSSTNQLVPDPRGYMYDLTQGYGIPGSED